VVHYNHRGDTPVQTKTANNLSIMKRKTAKTAVTDGPTPKQSGESESRGIKSIEVGYRVLLAVQRGPDAVPLSEIAKRAELSAGAAHNYLASLVRTGLTEQDGRGRYRLGPSAFALSVSGFQKLNGLELVQQEAALLYQQTGQNTAVTVWSQAGPVSVFTKHANNLGRREFRPGRVPMLASGAGLVYAAYLSEADIREPVEFELRSATRSKTSSTEFIARARSAVIPKGYALYVEPKPVYVVLSAPVWGNEHRLPFVMSLLGPDRKLDPDQNGFYLDMLLAACARASVSLAGAVSSGPVARTK